MEMPPVIIVEGKYGIEYRFFKHKGKTVAIFKNIFDKYIANDGSKVLEGETEEAVILEYMKETEAEKRPRKRVCGINNF